MTGPLPAAVEHAPAAGSAPLLDRALRPRVLGVPVLSLALLAFAAATVFANYIPARIDTLATEEAVADQQRENERLAARIERAESETRLMMTDRWANERVLRERMRMTRKGEAILR